VRTGRPIEVCYFQSVIAKQNCTCLPCWSFHSWSTYVEGKRVA